MSARDPSAAVEELFGPVQRAISCLTTAVLTGRRYHEADVPHVLFFAHGTDPAPLGRTGELALSVRHFYRLSGPTTGRPGERWRVATVGYIYELYDRDVDRVIAYHWHPIEGGEIGYPHLHVGRQFAHPDLPPDVRARADRLVRGHLPTEQVVLPAVLRAAITEFGVQPLRNDWPEVLADAERASRRLLPPR